MYGSAPSHWRRILLAAGTVLLTGCVAYGQQSAEPSMHRVILDFATEGVGMIVTFRVGDEAEQTASVQGRYYAYAATATAGSRIEARMQPIPAGAECGIGVTVDGKSIDGGRNRGAPWSGFVPTYFPVAPRVHKVVLDFVSDATSMDVTYRVGNGEATTMTVDGPWFTCAVAAEEESTILARVVPATATAWSSVAVTMDGRMLADGSGFGEVLRRAVLSSRGFPAYGSELHQVKILFGTEDSGMTVTYRVGTEDVVTTSASRGYVYSTSAADGATVFAVLTPKNRMAHCTVSVYVDGVEIGVSSDLGTIIRMEVIH